MKKMLFVPLAWCLILCCMVSPAEEERNMNVHASDLPEADDIGSVRDEAHKCFRVGPVSEGFTWIIVADEGAEDPWEEGDCYIIDVHGKRLTDDSVEVSIRYFNDGLLTVWKGDKSGCIDTEGNVVIPFDYDRINNFRHGFAVAVKGGKCGLISRANQIILPFEWDMIEEIILPDNAEGSLFLVERDGKYGIADMDGKETIPCIMDLIDYVSFDPSWPLLVRNGQSFGYADQTGTISIPCQWPNAQRFKDGVARVYTGKAFACIDASGKTLFTVPENWKVIGDFCEGLALTLDDGSQFGWIDATGAVVIPFKAWENAEDFHEGRAAVTRNGKIGFIDQNGNEVIPCEWDDAKPFYHGYAPAAKDGEWFMIDSEGNIAAPVGHVFIHKGKKNSLYEIMNEARKKGLMRYDGVFVTPCQWDFVLVFENDGLIYVTDANRKEGFLSIEGETIVPCVYDDAYYGDGYFTLIRDGYLTILDREGNIVF